MPDGVETRLDKLLKKIGGFIGTSVTGRPDIVAATGATIVAQQAKVTQDMIKEGKINQVDLVNSNLGSIDGAEIAAIIRDYMKRIIDDDSLKAIADTLGTIVTEPFVTAMEDLADDETATARDYAHRFHGASMLLTLPGMLAGTLRGNLVGTIMGDVGKAIEPMYWNLGLGFLGWQSLAPLLSSGMQPKLERYYNKVYTPKRFTLEDNRFLFVTDAIDANEFVKAYQEEGWRDSDIKNYLRLNWRVLNDTEINLLVKSGDLTLEDAKKEYLKRGYNPLYIPALLKDALQTSSETDKGPTLSQARTAYKNGLRTESQFRQLLNALGYNEEAIELEVEIQNQSIEDNAKELSLTQLREGFVNTVISEGEASYELTQQGYDTLDIQRIIRTWKAALKPKVLTLNQTSIKAAWRNNVISYPDALNKLTSVGYTAVDAKLIMDTAVAEAQAVAPKISLNLLMQAVAAGTLSTTAFKQELIARSYDVGSIDILTNLATAKPWAQLNQQDIYNAFVRSSITEQQAVNMLKTAGVTEGTITIRIETWKAEKERLRLKLTVGNIVEFYAKHVLDQPAARSYLVNLGLSLNEANLLLSSIDVPLPRKLSDTQIQNMYNVQILTRDQAINYLIGSGLAVEDASSLVGSWDRLIALYKPKPTVNQYIAAFQDGIITEQQLASNLATLGLTQDSINFYLNIAASVNVKGTKDLTKADIQGLVKDEILSYNEGLKRLIDLGYTPDDAQLLLNRTVTQIEDTQAHKLFVMGYLETDAYIDALLRLGYTQQEIMDYLIRIGVGGARQPL